MQEQLVDPDLGMGLDSDQHVSEVLLGTDAVDDADAHEGLVDREALTGVIIADEEEVLAIERDSAGYNGRDKDNVINRPGST